MEPQNTNAGSIAGTENLMDLTRAYMQEDPGGDSPTGHRLALVMGHFFMAMMPRASQNVILTMTGFCMTQLALQRLQAAAERRTADRAKRKGA